MDPFQPNFKDILRYDWSWCWVLVLELVVVLDLVLLVLDLMLDQIKGPWRGSCRLLMPPCPNCERLLL